MTDTPNNPPAYPLSPGDVPYYQEGMTMRQAYKIAALQGELAREEIVQDPAHFVNWIGIIADVMLAEDAEHAAKEANP